MNLKILISAPYMLPLQGRFQPIFDHFGLEILLAEVEERLSEAQLLHFSGQFDGAICGDDQFTRRVLEACSPRLKVISKWGTGIDSIDLKAATDLGIKVCNTPNAFTLPVADTIMGYILAYLRRQPWMDRAMKAGQWKKMPGRSLSECTLGVVGVGNIGKALIRRAHGFTPTILGTDIVKITPGFIEEYAVEMTGLEDLFRRSDFVSLNCDLNPTSHHLVNPKTLALMKPSAVLINTARGPCVDEGALIEALRTGRLAGAALDVFENEPLPADSPLLHFDHVMLAPHNANSSPTAWERVHWNTIHNLLIGLGLPIEDLETFIKKRG